MAELPKLPAFDFVPEAYSGPSKEEVLKMRNEHLSPALFKYYKSPIMLVNGKMQVRRWAFYRVFLPYTTQQSTSATNIVFTLIFSSLFIDREG
jgi:hypothetical protein